MYKQLALRALYIAGPIAAFYVCWCANLEGLGVIVALLGAAFIGRGIYKSKLLPNPRGSNRNFSKGPVLLAAAKGSGMIAAAFLWITLFALGIRFRILPDSDWIVLGLLIPSLAMIVLGVTHLFRAVELLQYGTKR